MNRLEEINQAIVDDYDNKETEDFDVDAGNKET